MSSINFADTPGSDMSISPSHNITTPRKTSTARRQIFASPNSKRLTNLNETRDSPLGCSTISLTPDSANVASPRRSPRLAKFASTPESTKILTVTGSRVKRKLIDDSVTTNSQKQKKRKTVSKQNFKVSKRSKDQKKRLLGGINAGVSHGIKKPKPKPLMESNSAKVLPKEHEQKESQETVNKPKTSAASLNKTSTYKEKQLEEQKKQQESRKIFVTSSLHSAQPRQSTGPKKFFKSRENLANSRIATVSLNTNLQLQLCGNQEKRPLRRSPRKHKTPEKAVRDLIDDWSDKEDAVSSSITSIIEKLEISPTSIEVMETSSNTDECESLILGIDSSMRLENKDVTSEKKFFPIFQKGSKTGNTPLKSRSENSQSSVKQWLRLRNDGPNQRILDAGQKLFGATQCNQCGLFYHVKDPDDEIFHAKIHDSLLTCLKFPGWKNEHIVRSFGSEGQVIVVSPRDAAYCWRKVNDVLANVVDVELGFAEIGIRKPELTKVYFYVTEKKIVGVLVAERVSRAYRILHADKEKGRCCSDVAESALVGISRIWTLATHRQQKVATRLVDSMRSDFIFSRFIDISELAFSDPTESGICFAEKYTERSDFLVYNM